MPTRSGSRTGVWVQDRQSSVIKLGHDIKLGAVPLGCQLKHCKSSQLVGLETPVQGLVLPSVIRKDESSSKEWPFDYMGSMGIGYRNVAVGPSAPIVSPKVEPERQNIALGDGLRLGPRAAMFAEYCSVTVSCRCPQTLPSQKSPPLVKSSSSS